MDNWIRNNQSRWHEMLQETASKYRADPSQPYNLHFYEAQLEGKLRIFDLFRDVKAITIGESLIGSMKSVAPLFSPPVESPTYTHVNYGGVISQDPDAVMEVFAKNHGLTDVRKLVEITVFNQMAPVMKMLLERLYSESGYSMDDRQRVTQIVSNLIPEFTDWLNSFPALNDLYASVGLDALTASGLIVVLGRIKSTEPPPSIYISLGIWLERRKKETNAN